MEKKFEVQCDETIKALKNFQEVSLSKFNDNNVDLSNISMDDCINLYATLERTKENITRLREILN